MAKERGRPRTGQPYRRRFPPEHAHQASYGADPTSDGLKGTPDHAYSIPGLRNAASNEEEGASDHPDATSDGEKMTSDRSETTSH